MNKQVGVHCAFRVVTATVPDHDKKLAVGLQRAGVEFWSDIPSELAMFPALRRALERLIETEGEDIGDLEPSDTGVPIDIMHVGLEKGGMCHFCLEAGRAKRWRFTPCQCSSTGREAPNVEEAVALLTTWADLRHFVDGCERHYAASAGLTNDDELYYYVVAGRRPLRPPARYRPQ